MLTLFFPSHILRIIFPSFSSSLPFVTEIWGHIARSGAPLHPNPPTTAHSFIVIARRFRLGLSAFEKYEVYPISSEPKVALCVLAVSPSAQDVPSSCLLFHALPSCGVSTGMYSWRVCRTERACTEQEPEHLKKSKIQNFKFQKRGHGRIIPGLESVLSLVETPRAQDRTEAAISNQHQDSDRLTCVVHTRCTGSRKGCTSHQPCSCASRPSRGSISRSFLR